MVPFLTFTIAFSNGHDIFHYRCWQKKENPGQLQDSLYMAVLGCYRLLFQSG
jgi:hypothetical protein